MSSQTRGGERGRIRSYNRGRSRGRGRSHTWTHGGEISYITIRGSKNCSDFIGQILGTR